MTINYVESGYWDSTYSEIDIAHVLDGAVANYTLTATTAELLRNRLIISSSGSYGITSQNVSLLYARIISGTAGSFTLSGITSKLLRGFTLPASTASFIESGLPVTLSYISLSHYSLTCGTSSFILSEKVANILVKRLLNASLANYNISSFDISLLLAGIPVSTAQNDWQILIKQNPWEIVIKQNPWEIGINI